MTPKSTTENLLYWAAALAVAVLLSALSGIATHWPEGGSIDLRAVTLDVIQTLLAAVPIVAAGFGLPRLGKEQAAALISKVGTQNAVDALHDEVDRQAGIPQSILLSQDQLQQVADELEARMKATYDDDRAADARIREA